MQSNVIPEGLIYIGKAQIGKEYWGNRYAVSGLACVLFCQRGWAEPGRPRKGKDESLHRAWPDTPFQWQVAPRKKAAPKIPWSKSNPIEGRMGLRAKIPRRYII